MKRNMLMMTAGAAAIAAGGAIAQETTSGADATGTMNSTATAEIGAEANTFTSLEEMTVGDVIGKDVIGPEGDTIGDIDYVVSGANGADAVIGIGGFLGLGEYTVALPLENFEWDAEQRVLTLDTDKETLEQEPEFDESGAESLLDETKVADLMPSEDEGMSDDAMSDDGTGDAAMSDDGAADQGMSDDSASDDAMSDDGATDEGVSDDGASDQGMSDDSASDDAMSDQGTDDAAKSDDSANKDEMTDDGAADDGAADDGSAEKTEENSDS